ncbi:hypothetical protein [Spirosoma luteum]|uniref:hypothetical protein n=1 Tax=Spirosoma luteum TaxID=431553 RepID=UPI00035F5349|nr:hypothetical protein [Spirosoma luteum]
MKTIEQFRQQLVLTENQFARAGTLFRQLVSQGILYRFENPVSEPIQSLFESDWGFQARQQMYKTMMASQLSTDYSLTCGLATLLSAVAETQNERSDEAATTLVTQMLRETKPLIEKIYPTLVYGWFNSPTFAAEFSHLLLRHTQIIGLGWAIPFPIPSDQESPSADKDEPMSSDTYLTDDWLKTETPIADSSGPFMKRGCEESSLLNAGQELDERNLDQKNQQIAWNALLVGYSTAKELETETVVEPAKGNKIQNQNVKTSQKRVKINRPKNVKLTKNPIT